jgi:hypothetical protein
LIVIKLIGGLGNQLFQYANGIALSKEYNQKVFFDISFYNIDNDGTYAQRKFELNTIVKDLRVIDGFRLFIFRLKIKFSSPCLFFIKFRKVNLIVDHLPGYRKIEINNFFDYYIDGYFQSEYYFKKYAEFIKSSFDFINLSEKTNILYNQILTTNSVSIHVRRGDYANDPKINSIHGMCNLVYYINSINQIKHIVENPVFYFFSDDIEWVKSTFEKLENKFKFVFISSSTNLIDFYLMSLCKNNIIANSSFSWWSAWINNNPDKVVLLPKKWYNNEDLNLLNIDMSPISWIQIED